MSDPINTGFDDQRIISLRGEKHKLDPSRPYGYNIEKERKGNGKIEDVLTIFLSNSECPYKCLMCDLWVNTLDHPVQKGDIPEQIRWTLTRVPEVDNIKLYNSGNFFDKRAIPTEDYPAIARLLSGFKTVTIECHPKLIGSTSLEFSDMLSSELEIAIGLETVHPRILPLLNKKMSCIDFESSVRFLNKNGIRSRAFILLKPPFMTEVEGILWAKKSIDFAFEAGIGSCVIIPTRTGNGATDLLKRQGMFSEPKIESLEEVLEYGIGIKKGNVFADLWDLERFSSCNICYESRKHRLNEINLYQRVPPAISCSCLTD